MQELLSGAMAAADAAAAAAVVADSEAARRKERAEHKRQRKRHRDRGSHNKRTNKRKNLRRSEGRKGRARTRVQMAPVLSQLLHRSPRSRQVSGVVEPMNKQARPMQICTYVPPMSSAPLNLTHTEAPAALLLAASAPPRCMHACAGR